MEWDWNLTLGLGVDNHLGEEAKQKVPDQANGEAERRPIVAHLQNLESIAVEVNIAIKVLFVKSLLGDLVLAVVGLAVLLFVELEVVLNGLARKLGLFVLAGSIFGGNDPKGSEDGEVNQQSKKEPRLETPTEGPGDVGGDTNEQREQSSVGKVLRAGTVGRQRSIGNGRILQWVSNQLTVSCCGRSMAGGVLSRASRRWDTHGSGSDAAVKGRGGRRGRRRRLNPLEIVLRGRAAHDGRCC